MSTSKNESESNQSALIASPDFILSSARSLDGLFSSRLFTSVVSPASSRRRTSTFRTLLCLSLPACDAVFCLTLNSTGNITDQMLTCNLETFGFGSSTGVFDLSTWNQATYDKAFLYSKGNSQFYKSIIGEVKIINSKLTAVILDFRKDATKSFGANILRNQHLSELRITVEDSNGKVEVHGNKLLKKKWVKLIKNLNATSKDVQEAGECMPVATLSSLDELSYCKHIKGNVVIDGSTKIARVNGTKRLTKFEGCLSVKNSNVDTLDFLGALTATDVTCSDSNGHVVEGNHKLCKYSPDLERIRGWGNATIRNNMDCDQECDFTKAKSKSTGDKCNVFKGDLKIDQTVNIDDRDMKSMLERIEKLKGRLIVENTLLAKFDVLPKLPSIEAMNPDHSAIDVIGNTNLAKFELPALKKIVMHPDTKHFPLDMEKNGNFTFTWEEFDRWNKMTGVEHHMLPHEDAPATTTPTTPAPTTMTTTLLDRDKAIVASNAQRQQDNEAKEKLHTMIAIVAPSAFVIIMLILTALAVFFYWWTWRNDPQNKKRQEPQQVQRKRMLKEDSCETVRAEEQTQADEEKAPVECAKGGEEDIYDEVTLAPGAMLVKDYKNLDNFHGMFLRMHKNSNNDKLDTKKDEAQFCLSKEVPKKWPYLSKEGLDFAKAETVPEEKMKKDVGVYKYEVNFTRMFYDPNRLASKEAPKTEELDKWDQQAWIQYMMTGTSDCFFERPELTMKWLTALTMSFEEKYENREGFAMRQMEGPVHIVGDIHGSLADLQVILNMDPTGQAAAHQIHPAFYYKWIFMGDYIDRGFYSLECLLLLCMLADRLPQRFVVLRGNHESTSISDEGYLFKKMLESPLYGPYGAMVVHWQIKKLIDCLPFACLVNNQIFCTHGGISHKLTSAQETSLVELFGKLPMPKRTCETRIAFSEPKQWYKDYKTVEEWNEIKQKSVEERKKMAGESSLLSKLVDGIEGRSKADKMFERQMVEMEEKIKEEFEDETAIRDTGIIINDAPFLDDCLWSDPIPALAIPSNRRNRGVSFDQRELDAFRKKYNISMVIRGHEDVGWQVNADATLWTLFANNNTSESCKPVGQLELNVNRGDSRGGFSGVLRLNDDSTLTVMMFKWAEDGAGHKRQCGKPPKIIHPAPKRRQKRDMEKVRLHRNQLAGAPNPKKSAVQKSSQKPK